MVKRVAMLLAAVLLAGGVFHDMRSPDAPVTVAGCVYHDLRNC